MDIDQGVPNEVELVEQVAASMSEDIEEVLQRLTESTGGRSCTVFRVPEAIGGGIAEACRPRIVSIGPYHHGEQQLQMLQGLKWRYLNNMLGRIQHHGVHFENLIHVVAHHERMIQQCYWESTGNFRGPDLVRMMVLDGCFIIEFLRQLGRVVRKLDEPLSSNIYMSASVMQDLLRLENQVPYFVLEVLNEITNVPEATSSLAGLLSNFFSCILKRPGNFREELISQEGVHLLDAFRLSLLPGDQQQNQVNGDSCYSMIRSASELRRVGIGFKQREASTFLDIKFDRKRRIVGIPKITVDDDDLNWILPNMVTFEQCRGRWNDCHVTAYAMFMGSLIHTVDDVQLLRDYKVISNHGMSNEEFARFFNDIRKAAPFELVKDNYLASQVTILNRSLKYERAHLCSAQLLNAFHDNPWSVLSGLAVVVTLVGIIQTVYAVLQYYHRK